MPAQKHCDEARKLFIMAGALPRGKTKREYLARARQEYAICKGEQRRER